MKKMMNWFKQEESGQGMVEYALIIALVAVVLIASLTALQTSTNSVFNKIKNVLTSSAPGVPGTTDEPELPGSEAEVGTEDSEWTWSDEENKVATTNKNGFQWFYDFVTGVLTWLFG